VKRQRARSDRRRGWLLLAVLASGILLIAAVGHFVERDLRDERSRLIPPLLRAGSEIVARLGARAVEKPRPGDVEPTKNRLSPSTREPTGVLDDTPEVTVETVVETVETPTPTDPRPAGPWDAVLSKAPSPFETTWFRWSSGTGTRATEEDLRVWLDPVDSGKDRFFTVVRKTTSFPGIDGVFRLRAPLPQGAALRLSLPEHRSLRLHVRSGDRGVMIQAHDANDAQRNLRKELEDEVRGARESHRVAETELGVLRDAARGPESTVADARKRVEKTRSEIEQAGEERVAAREVASEAKSAHRDATKEKADALRDAPRATQRGRDAGRRLQKARQEHRANLQAPQLAAAVRRAEKDVADANRAVAEAAHRKNEALERFTRTNTAKRDADRQERRIDQTLRLLKSKLRREEKRHRENTTRARLAITRRESAARDVAETAAAVTAARAKLDEAIRRAVARRWESSATPDAWVAYSTTRSPQSVAPLPDAILATDGGRVISTDLHASSRIELRYQAGHVVLTRGDVTVLEAPLDGPPTEVLLGGRLLFDDIGMTRTSSAPTRTGWETVALPPAAKLEPAVPTAADGEQKITVRAEVLELELEAIAGAGVDLEDADGTVLTSLEYASASHDGHCVIGWKKSGDGDGDGDDGDDADGNDARDGDGDGEMLRDIDRRVLPLVRGRHHLRFLFGIEHVKCWVRTAGARWTVIGLPRPLGKRPVASVVLRGPDEPQETTVAAHRTTASTLRELGSIFPSAQVLPFAHPAATGLDDWRRATLSQKPQELDDDEWVLACACRSLRGASTEPLADSLIDLVLEDPSIRVRSTTDVYRLLDEICLLRDLSRDESRLRRMVDRYHRVAARAERRQEPAAFENLRRALLAAPMHTRFRFSASDPELAARQLLALLYRGQWEKADAFSRALLFYALDVDKELVGWTRSLLEMRLPGRADWPHVKLDPSWRHPLLEEIEKELYNDLADFQAAVASDDHRAAGQVALEIDPRALTGVGPSDSDRQLLVSLPTAIVATRYQAPGLWARMVDEIGPRSLLRVRRSISRGDVLGVEQATVQYRGTSAAREAHRWIGDRALAAGDFLTASAHFSLARDARRQIAAPGIDVRLRLAAAMLGHDVPPRIDRPVELAGVEMEAPEFELLLRDLRGRASNRRSPFVRMHGAPANPARFPHGDRLTTRVHDSLEGVPDGEPGGVSRGRNASIDRRRSEHAIAVSLHANRVIINTGVQVTALDLRTGLRVWTTPRGDRRRPDAWPMTRLDPLVSRDRIFTRLWSHAGPQLVCIDQHDGSQLWQRDRSKVDEWICDPMAHGGRLFALSLTQPNHEGSRLRLLQLDAGSGAELSSFELAKLRRSWWNLRSASVTTTDGCFVASLGGVVLRADFGGRVHWIRKQLVVPAEAYEEKTPRMLQPPLICRRDVIVAQPGVGSVECIDETSGQLRWQLTVPDLESLRGVTAGVLVLATGGDLRAVDVESGELGWSNESLSWRDPTWIAGEGELLVSQTTQIENRLHPELVRIDARTGTVIDRRRLDGLADAAPRLGPIFTTPHRAWALFERASQGPRLHLVEITAK